MAANQQELTVAIDIGTNSCAVAYSSSKEENVVVIEWGDGDDNKKVPTAVLFKNDRMVEFGHEAVETFKSILSNKKELREYSFFQNFKMALYTDTEIQVRYF